MIAQLEKEYRGVLCRQCGQPIPASPRIVDLHEDNESTESHAPRAFVVRCRLCDHESVYPVTDIRKFEGEPRPRRLKARKASA
jgi:RNase P subunit RPR2